MNVNKELVRKHFNRYAHSYDHYAEVQRDMGKMLFQKVQQARMEQGYTRILEIGCGTGYLTQLLMNEYPDALFTVVDLSEAMIHRTKERVGSTANSARFLTADGEHLDLNSQQFDLIVSNAAFQWFNKPKHTLQGYFDHLPVNGVFAFSTFGPRTFHELHDSYAKAEQMLGLKSIQHGQSFGSMNDWKEIFADQMTPMAFDQDERIEIYPSVREFLYNVKGLGAGNALDSSSNKAMGGRKCLELMEQIYDQEYKVKSGIRATYQLYSGIYHKK